MSGRETGFRRLERLAAFRRPIPADLWAAAEHEKRLRSGGPARAGRVLAGPRRTTH